MRNSLFKNSSNLPQNCVCPICFGIILTKKISFLWFLKLILYSSKYLGMRILTFNWLYVNEFKYSRMLLGNSRIFISSRSCLQYSLSHPFFFLYYSHQTPKQKDFNYVPCFWHPPITNSILKLERSKGNSQREGKYIKKNQENRVKTQWNFFSAVQNKKTWYEVRSSPCPGMVSISSALAGPITVGCTEDQETRPLSMTSPFYWTPNVG